MMHCYHHILILLVCLSAMPVINTQAPPGVNPQVYQEYQNTGGQMTQQQAQQLAFQQQQQQQLAMQQHQQQMAMQQQAAMQHQQQQAFQQIPQQLPQHPPQHPPQGHHPQAVPQGGHQGQQVFHAQNMANEREHIGQHIDVPVDTSRMTEQELQFHYFKMHDADNNNKLDGCELVKSLIHWHDQANHDPKAGAPMPDPKIFSDAELLAMIDPILEQDDKNKDGFIDYPEFIQAQQASGSVQ